MRSRQSARDGGFILAAVLWVLAGLSLLASLVSDVTQSAAARVNQLRTRTEFVREQQALRAEVIYWLANTVPTRSGYSDGATFVSGANLPYAVAEAAVVQLQDLGGLLDINQPEPSVMARLLVTCGVPADQTPLLMDALDDYVDADNLSRANGAEQDVYVRAGLQPPRNGPLIAVREVFGVWGWRQHQGAIEKSNCLDAFGATGTGAAGGAVNLATAPASVLRASGLEGAELEASLQLRAQVGSNLQVAAAFDATLSGQGLFGIGRYAQKAIRVTQQAPNQPWEYQYTLEFTPRDAARPWVIREPKIQALRPEQIARANGASRWPELAPPKLIQNAPNRSPF